MRDVHSNFFAYLPVMRIRLRNDRNGFLFATTKFGGHVKSIEAHSILYYPFQWPQVTAER
jgi:hypothetical protein